MRLSALLVVTTLLVGPILLVAPVPGVVESAELDKQRQAFIQQIQQRRDAFVTQQAGINQRLAAIPFDRWTSENIASDRGRADLRAMLGSYQTLQDERMASMRKYFRDQEDFIKARAVTNKDKQEALAALARVRSGVEKMLTSISGAESELTKSMLAALDWADAQHGTLRASGGKFVFANSKQEEEGRKVLALLVVANRLKSETVERSAAEGEKLSEQWQRHSLDSLFAPK